MTAKELANVIYELQAFAMVLQALNDGHSNQRVKDLRRAVKQLTYRLNN